MFECPGCGENTISLKDKHLMGYWLSRNCKKCGTRVGARPIPLAFLHFVYTWEVLWFFSLYVYSAMNDRPDPSYLLYMVIGWIFLDIVNIGIIPMGAMKRKT